MAENVLETRIQLRYGTYSEWMKSRVILKRGEAAICTFPSERVIDKLSDTTPIYTPPAIGIKIGDGTRYFYELPWVQAIAADVYNWAKSSTKPTYTASEISGLQTFIEDNFHISGDVTIAPRIYQLVQGTGDNQYKYYLRYKENNEDAQWVTDTNQAIDLTPYQEVKDWIGSYAIDNYFTIGDFIGYLASRRISNLNFTDTAVAHKFVTSVSENAGIISVERVQPAFSDISGTAQVTQGGTGATSFPYGEVLVGNDAEAIQTLPITDTIDNSNNLATNRAIKAYVDSATAGLTGAMHFVGEASVVITSNSSVNPQIRNYDFTRALPGDVILYGSQEFVWDGAHWILLGDESSYAIKGSIVDVDISENANIQQHKIAGLTDALSSKVDKVEGKTLTSNDFTDELKQKLEDIGTNAETNVIEHIMVNDVEVRPITFNNVDKVVNLQISEFDTLSKEKLASIETNAQVNKIEKIIFDGQEVVPENQVVTITSDPHKEHENVIESIIVNGKEYPPNKDKQVNITIDQAALNLNVLEGAQVPNGAIMQEVEQVEKKLQLARIAATGDVKDILQSNDEYITLYCGSSTQVI